jgi:hypothetical protein
MFRVLNSNHLPAPFLTHALFPFLMYLKTYLNNNNDDVKTPQKQQT